MLEGWKNMLNKVSGNVAYESYRKGTNALSVAVSYQAMERV